MNKNGTALIIVDMQNGVKTLVPTMDSVVSPIERVIEIFRERRAAIVYNLRVHRADGSDVEKFRLERFIKNPYLVEGTKDAEVINELKPAKGDHVIIKRRFDGFFETDMHMVLSRLGIKSLVICGVQTPACVRATVTGAIERDYDVVVLSDATAAATPEIQKANLFDMHNLGAKIMTVEELTGLDL